MTEIELYFKRAIVSPGEMVGIIGAQTLGEISTQLTLNSVIYETEIIVRDQEKNIMKVKIITLEILINNQQIQLNILPAKVKKRN